MADPIYYQKDLDVLYRREDGDVNLLPDQVLWSRGWRPLPGAATHSASPFPGPAPKERGGLDGSADPNLLDVMRVVTEERAKEIAVERDLPTTDW